MRAPIFTLKCNFSVRSLVRAGLFALLPALLVACGGGGGAGGGTANIIVDNLAPAAPVNLDAVAALYSIEYSGMGGDSSGDGGAAGGAGDGSPLRSAIVTLVDAKGNKVNGLTDSNGNFLLKFSTKTFVAPYILRAIDAGGNVLTSVTDEAAPAGKVVRVNINPLTDKITSDVLAASVAGTDKAFDGSQVDISKLALAKSNLVTSIKAALNAAGISDTSRFDPVKSVYKYDGKGVDAVIESLSHTRDPVTGATQLGIKLASVVNDATTGVAIPSVVTATAPLPAAQVALSGSPALTFEKVTAWVTALNRCLSLTPAAAEADTVCGSTSLVSDTFLHNSMDFKEYNKKIFSIPAATSGGQPQFVQGTTLRNPVLLFTTKYPNSTATYDDLAVVELTVMQPSVGALAGPVNGPVEYTVVYVFKRDDTLKNAVAGNWIAHGNQHLYNSTVRTRYRKTVQVNPLKDQNAPGGWPGVLESRIELNFSKYVFNKSTRTWVDANVRAVRAKGPGLPSQGVVLLPDSAVGATFFAIENKTGSIPSVATTKNGGANSFVLAGITSTDGSDLYSGYYSPSGITNPTTMVTDFSVFTPYSRYTFEIFLNSNTNGFPDAVEYNVNLTGVVSPRAAAKMQFNDISLSSPLVSPTATTPLPSSQSLTVTWANNLNAAPVNGAQVYAEERNPKGSSATYTVQAWDVVPGVSNAYSLDVRPTSKVVTAPTGSPFPSLGSGVAGDYRHIGIFSYQGRANMHTIVMWTN